MVFHSPPCVRFKRTTRDRSVAIARARLNGEDSIQCSIRAAGVVSSSNPVSHCADILKRDARLWRDVDRRRRARPDAAREVNRQSEASPAGEEAACVGPKMAKLLPSKPDS
jgi:hypothetical protein